MAEKIRMQYTDHFERVMAKMTSKGILLATWKDDSKTANAMTIGWGLIGSVWSRPIFQVMVRPSRLTYSLMEKNRRFTVNVLPKAFDEAVVLCGTKSGRSMDKLKESGLTVFSSKATGSPVIAESVIHYECHIIHSNDFLPEAMIPNVREGAYPSGDYHRVYWGEIVDCCVDMEKLQDL
jgi:flavin reductase (DIM6/NTAB) family NADH-FMN oxidoreductase RutF